MRVLRSLRQFGAVLLLGPLVATACGKSKAADGAAAARGSDRSTATALAANARASAANGSASTGSAVTGSTVGGAPTGAAGQPNDSTLVDRADRGRLKGPGNAMWVVMISDFQCPYCKQWHDSSMAKLERDFIAPGKIHFAYVHLPLSSIHKHAHAEAIASLCASAQGKFWEYGESLFAAQPTVASMNDVSPLLSRIAKEQALDLTAFDQCRTNGAVQALLNNDIQQATKAGVQSTPSFIIGEFLVQGAIPYPDFRKAVDSALVLARAKQRPR